MKTLTAILLTFLVISCKCQEPDIACYSQERWDSLLSVNVMNEALNNELIHIIENQNDSIQGLNYKIETLRLMVDELINPCSCDTTIFDNDTIMLKLVGNEVTVNVSKICDRVNYQIVEGLHRINLFYDNLEFDEYLMYDSISYEGRNVKLAIPVK